MRTSLPALRQESPALGRAEVEWSPGVQTRWPWITSLLGPVFLVTPLGRELIEGALSGEQLARNISQPILAIVMAIWAFLVACEWIARWLIARRYATKDPPR